MLTISVEWSKLKNLELKELKPRGIMEVAVAFIRISELLLMLALDVAIFKPLPVKVSDCERYGLDALIREGKKNS